MTRRLVLMLVAAMFAAVLALPALAQDSLADAARAAMKNKRPKPANEVVYTNDNIYAGRAPSTAGSSITPAGAYAYPNPPANAQANAPANPQPADQDTAASAADKKQQEEEWRKKFADAKGEIELLQREYDVAQKEHQLQAAAFYADAGTRLRDDRRWADQEREFQATMTDKKAKIDAAKQKLDDMREELRKAGLPSSWAE